jgi:hypothetical protein
VDSIALLPGVIAVFVLWRRGVESAFLDVYLPSLILFPWYCCILPGVPDPSFSQSAMIPLAVVFFWQSRFRWRFSAVDLVVLTFAAWAFVSELLTHGFIEAQNISLDVITQGVIAWIFGKELIGRRGNSTKFARRFVFLLFLICVASVYEFRFLMNPFRAWLLPFFPGQAFNGAGTQMRWNVGRVCGPFAHSILAGVTFMSGILVNVWLAKSGKWERDFRWLPGFPLTKGTMLTLGLLAGSIMTLSRGPWLSGIFGIAILGIGTARYPRKALFLASAFVVVAAAASWTLTRNYTSAGQKGAQSEEQESAAYRAELMDKYKDIAFERPVWGWGHAAPSWPKVPGMVSIDNAYLFMMLLHGVVYAAIFAAFLAIMVLRLVWAGLHSEPKKCAELFMLAGVMVSFAIAFATVWMPADTQGIVFLFAGWAEGRILERSLEVRQEIRVARALPYRFETVYT